MRLWTTTPVMHIQTKATPARPTRKNGIGLAPGPSGDLFSVQWKSTKNRPPMVWVVTRRPELSGRNWAEGARMLPVERRSTESRPSGFGRLITQRLASGAVFCR